MSKLKKEFQNELVKLGLFDAWGSNMLKTYKDTSTKIEELNRLTKFSSFIAWSFPWGMAIEGSEFWSSIYRRYDHENI
jgi:hypothetical protein